MANPKWYKGMKSPNPGGRPKDRVKEYAKRNAYKVMRELKRIAMREDRVIKDENGKVVQVIAANDGAKTAAAREFLRIAGEYPSEKQEITVANLSDGERQKRLDALLAKAKGQEPEPDEDSVH